MRTTLLLLAVVLSLGCASSSGGPGPGSTQPGDTCSHASDCGCWACTCEGLSGSPGAAQLCVNGVCPTGAEACATSCGAAGAKVATATPVDSCPAVP